MVPPYLAYYGALSTGNESITLLQEAYDQCRAYREILRDPEANLWKHIVLGTGLQDYTHWGTGMQSHYVLGGCMFYAKARCLV